MHFSPILDTPIQWLPGIGEQRATVFQRVGISDIGSLFYYFPRAYEHRGNIKLLSEAKNGETCAFLLTVATQPRISLIRRGMQVIKFVAVGERDKCTITFFNQPYVATIFTVGATFRFWGKLTISGMGYDLTSPAYEPYMDGTELLPFLPVYPLTEGLSQKVVTNAVRNAWKIVLSKEDSFADVLPISIRTQYTLCSMQYALQQIHFPQDFETLRIAKRRLIFEELFLTAMGTALSKQALQQGNAPLMKKIALQPFFESLPYALTNAQKRVIQEIATDFMNPDRHPMNRLLSGDVGSGKTICAAAAIYLVLQNGYQAALMAPTEILARQHFLDLQPLFEKWNWHTALLIGSIKASEKKKIYANLADGTIDFVIGTHALLQDAVQFQKLGLIITDEQHRFGVRQRQILAEKQANIHVLVLSATPIPRTLALILYGDLSLSVLDEMPPGRKRVDTFLVDERTRERLYAFIHGEVMHGRQVYIVCPAIEENKEETDVISMENMSFFTIGSAPVEEPPLKAAVDYAAHLQKEIFPDLQVGFLHGKMKSAEKECIMGAFVKNEISILVSTTVIEVGVNVPNATLMVVENAERFGLSQLHQLRGRVGRGKYQSYCFLMSDSQNETSRKRLHTLQEIYDGYQIAEKDLELRGPGDFMIRSNTDDPRQHGSMKFRLASLCENVEELKQAFEAANQVMDADPSLEKEENAVMKQRMQELFAENNTRMN